MIEDRLIFDLIFHESLLPHGCDRNGQALMLRPPETAVNRRSGRHDGPGGGCRRKRMCPEPFHGAWRLVRFSPFPFSLIMVDLS